MKQQLKIATQLSYATFDQIDGKHPLQQALPESCVMYPVFQRESGKVMYFNFDLAREMGLIDQNHPEKLTAALEKKLLETFNLQIINEWDEKNGTPLKRRKPHKYMATRYLQLQHDNKQGKTSGDGRSIWNGYVVGQDGKHWDVSSRGTGVTCLAPGAVQAQKPLKTGSTQFGYGCGLADIDELMGSALQSEIFHRQGVHTERVLCIIDGGKNCGIGVRVGENLLRPAHLFLYLKQNRREELTRGFQYFLDRQKTNKKKMTEENFLQATSLSMAKFLAYCEVHHIFVWLDWDGDNCLLDTGIIDYGSVRQFGLRHDQYRYDDVQRFSTNLLEQKLKGMYLLQNYIQMVDYIKTGRKKSLQYYRQHPLLKRFKTQFQEHKRRLLLDRFGFSDLQKTYLLRFQKKKAEKFLAGYEYLESIKTSQTLNVPDGINIPPLLDMKESLRLLGLDFQAWADTPVREKLALDKLKLQAVPSQFCKRKDHHKIRKLEPIMERMSRELVNLIKYALDMNTMTPQFFKKLVGLGSNMEKNNGPHILTGNATIQIIDLWFKKYKKTADPLEVQLGIERILHGSPNSKELELILENRQSI